MREHDWELTGHDQHAESDRTRFEWRCRNCTSETFTYGAGKLGTHAAEAHRPGRRALQGSWVDADCLQALVDRTHEW